MGTEAQHASPEPAVFRTTFGIPMLLMTLPVVCLNLFIPPLDGVSFAILALSAATVVVMVYAMLSTKYRVVDGVLHLHQGPFRRSVDLESISRIRVGSSMFGAPLYGMGTRGLFIYYRLGVVGVTPKDVDGFLASIGARRTESGDVEIAL